MINLTEYKTLSELREFAEKQFVTILQLQNDLKLKDEKIKHLEDLLNVVPATEFIVEDKEAEICKMEINRLYHKSCRIPLDDKEIRNLEILVKTLAVAKGKNVSDVKEKKDKDTTKNMNVGQLVSLAKSIGTN